MTTEQPGASPALERPVRPCPYNAGTCARRGCIGGCQAMQLCQPDGLMFDALGQPRKRYVRVTLNGSHCVMLPSEGDCHVQEARDNGDPDWERYIVRDVYLSDREFEDLPEFGGF